MNEATPVISKALSNKDRIKILNLLNDGPLSIMEISHKLKIPVSTTANHIQILDDARLIMTEYTPTLKGHMKLCSRMIVNYTSKTQCLFRISKGVLDIREDKKVNEKVLEKHVEFENMIYIGDGITDVPCMTLIKERNGLSIAVYKSGKSETAEPLVNANRVEVSVTADYRDGSRLDKIVKAKIDYIALTQK